MFVEITDRHQWLTKVNDRIDVLVQEHKDYDRNFEVEWMNRHMDAAAPHQ